MKWYHITDPQVRKNKTEREKAKKKHGKQITNSMMIDLNTTVSLSR